MDFLPRVQDPVHPHISVPDFVQKGDEYEPGEFFDSPKRRGWDLEALKKGDFKGRTWKEAASFVQAWAYFGMIVEVLELSDYNVGFVGKSAADEKGTVDWFSSTLNDLVLMWFTMERRRERSKEEKKNLALKCSRILIRVSSFISSVYMEELCGGEKVSSSTNVLDDEDDRLRAHMERMTTGEHAHYAGRVLTDQYWARNRNFFSDEPDWEKGIYGRWGSPGHALFFSIVVTGELLANAARVIWGFPILPGKWPKAPLLNVLLAQSGWCCVEVDKLLDRCTTTRAYYISSIRRRPLEDKEKHNQCCPNLGWDVGCVVNRLNEENYVVKHTSDGCTCNVVSFRDSLELEQWIKTGRTGLLVSAGSGNDTNQKWKLISSHDAAGKPVRYVAISHVWADGTGNPKDNALPACQLEKFQNAVNGLYEDSQHPVPFWVDTVCVPQKKDLKILSIRRMDKIYKEADNVLVFDATLETQSSKASPTECLTRIELSTWMTRLWTMQEGLFGRRLHFKFKDGVETTNEFQLRYRYERMIRFMEEFPNVPDERMPFKIALAGQLMQFDKTEYGQPTEFEHDSLQLDEVFCSASGAVGSLKMLNLRPGFSVDLRMRYDWLVKELPYRQTSKVPDEPICLGILLGMDVEKLEKLPTEEKIAKWFEFVGSIDAGILFGSRPRFSTPGRKWMPSTALGHSQIVRGPNAKVLPFGLAVSLPGATLKRPEWWEDMMPKTWVIVNAETNHGYLAELDMESGKAIKFEGHGKIYAVLEEPLGSSDVIHGVLAVTGSWHESDPRIAVEYGMPLRITGMSHEEMKVRLGEHSHTMMMNPVIASPIPEQPNWLIR
jgi:hypothetical protein